MVDLQKFNQSLDQMVQLMLEMKRALAETPNTAPVMSAQSVVPVPPAPISDPVVPTIKHAPNSYESLKEIVLSNKWPEAVNPNLICDPQAETDKQDRGRGIIELMIEEDLKGLRFLDFGCGEGHCAGLAKEYNPLMAVGYDVKSHPTWDTFPFGENLRFTTDIQEVESLGPYNVILMFDVIDHLTASDPVTVLSKARGLLADNGKIYMRCHPFTSRHATHLYHTLNKAYLHLIFTENELADLVPDCPYKETSARVIYPIKTYNDIIEKSSLKIINKRDITEQPETFFKAPNISERIVKNTKMGQFPEFQMSLQFVDYVLGK